MKPTHVSSLTEAVQFSLEHTLKIEDTALPLEYQPPVEGGAEYHRIPKVRNMGDMWMKRLVIFSREWKTRELLNANTDHAKGPLATTNKT